MARLNNQVSSVRPGAALREVRRRGYTASDLRADAVAGLILGVVALPLSMALAIAAGARPNTDCSRRSWPAS